MSADAKREGAARDRQGSRAARASEALVDEVARARLHNHPLQLRRAHEAEEGGRSGGYSYEDVGLNRTRAEGTERFFRRVKAGFDSAGSQSSSIPVAIVGACSGKCRAARRPAPPRRRGRVGSIPRARSSPRHAPRGRARYCVGRRGDDGRVGAGGWRQLLRVRRRRLHRFVDDEGVGHSSEI